MTKQRPEISLDHSEVIPFESPTESHTDLAHEVNHHLNANESAAVGLHERALSAINKLSKMKESGDFENGDKLKEIEEEIDSLLAEFKAKNAELNRKVEVAETRFNDEPDEAIANEAILKEEEESYDEPKDADNIEAFSSKKELENKLVDEAMKDYRTKRTASGRVRLEKSLVERTERKKAGKSFDINVGKFNKEIAEHHKKKLAAKKASDVPWKTDDTLITKDASHDGMSVSEAAALYEDTDSTWSKALSSKDVPWDTEENTKPEASVSKTRNKAEKADDENGFTAYGDDFQQLPSAKERFKGSASEKAVTPTPTKKERTASAEEIRKAEIALEKKEQAARKTEQSIIENLRGQDVNTINFKDKKVKNALVDILLEYDHVYHQSLSKAMQEEGTLNPRNPEAIEAAMTDSIETLMGRGVDYKLADAAIQHYGVATDYFPKSESEYSHYSSAVEERTPKPPKKEKKPGIIARFFNKLLGKE